MTETPSSGSPGAHVGETAAELMEHLEWRLRAEPGARLSGVLVAAFVELEEGEGIFWLVDEGEAGDSSAGEGEARGASRLALDLLEAALDSEAEGAERG